MGIFYLLTKLAYRPATRNVQQALLLCLLGLRALRSHLARFASLACVSKKKCVSINSNCSETRKNANKMNNKKNKKHSENADTSTSVTFDM